MRRFMLVALAAVASLGVVVAPAEAKRPKAHVAAVQVGRCVLHAYTPHVQGSGVQAHGRVDTCGSTLFQATLTLQVCLQVQGPGGYGAFTKQETCTTTGPYTAISIDSPSFVAYDAVRGHEYRSWAWVRVKDTNGSVTTGWYVSDWWRF